VRLRRKPWVDEAIHDFDSFVFSKDLEIGEEKKGQWAEIFGRQAPLHVELGTGKGDFISQLAERNPDINYIGIEMQQDVLYSAAKKIAAMELKNVRLLVFDINKIGDIFAPGKWTASTSTSVIPGPRSGMPSAA
jgi:tRNA (guanine-N7-)-methyltransferase